MIREPSGPGVDGVEEERGGLVFVDGGEEGWAMEDGAERIREVLEEEVDEGSFEERIEGFRGRCGRRESGEMRRWVGGRDRW